MKLKLMTPIEVSKFSKQLDCNSIIAGIGSCFAQYMIEQFAKLGIKTSSNPNGIAYNSHSILDSLLHLEEKYTEDNFIFLNNLWHSWAHHGSFSSATKEELIEKINESKNHFLETIKIAGLFIFTPSSSVVYKLQPDNLITANCHKFPNNNFSVGILSKEENLANLKKSINIIRSMNANCNIVITLSPVRHYPGNLVLNARSKANLLSAIHECAEQIKDVVYFPAYEILLDELRDYRFYADDMLHPSELARKIIFERFAESCFNERSLGVINERDKQIRLSAHRALKQH